MYLKRFDYRKVNNRIRYKTLRTRTMQKPACTSSGTNQAPGAVTGQRELSLSPCAGGFALSRGHYSSWGLDHAQGATVFENSKVDKPETGLPRQTSCFGLQDRRRQRVCSSMDHSQIWTVHVPGRAHAAREHCFVGRGPYNVPTSYRSPLDSGTREQSKTRRWLMGDEINRCFPNVRRSINFTHESIK